MAIKAESDLNLKHGGAVWQYLAAMSCFLYTIASGTHYGWPSPSLPKLLSNTSTIQVTDDQGSWIAVMPLLGSLLGSLMVGTTVDMLGRKKTILLSSLPFFGAWIMIAYANKVLVIFVARFIAGIAEGWIFTAIPMYIGEISEPSIRGMLGSCVSVTWIFGQLLINVVGSYLDITTTAWITSCIPVICFISFIFMPESPYHLMIRGESGEAKHVLQKLRGREDVENELRRIRYAINSQNMNGGKIMDLITNKANRRALMIIVVLRTVQQFSGTTAVTFYTQMIFMEAGGEISSEAAAITYFSMQFCLTFFCSSIVDRAGRKPLLLISVTGSGVFLLIEGIYFFIKYRTSFDIEDFSFVSMIALIGFVITFSVGLQSIPILLLGELFPTNVKGYALGMADIYFSLLAVLVSKFFQIMKDEYGIYTPFFAFASSCFVGIVLINICMIETKGKTLEEIQSNLSGKKVLHFETTERHSEELNCLNARL